MNKSDFYAALRRRNSGVFGTSLSQAQVDGMPKICAQHNTRHLVTAGYHKKRKARMIAK